MARNGTLGSFSSAKPD